MNKIPILIGLLMLLIITNSYSLKFIAYGDSRTGASTHQRVVNRFAQENPELVVHSGDLWDDYTSSEWKSHFNSVSNIASLLTNNKILVARGNHESESEVLNFSPSIVRDNSIEFSYVEGNCFFVSMGYDPGANNSWLETQLQSTESQNADWRFIYAHKPVYSTGDHGANGITSEGSNVTNFRSLCDQYEVTMFFSGHDHFYERTYLIYEGQTASEETEINITETPGTFYFVTGGGGAPLYSTDSDWWVGVNERTYHYCVLDATADRLEFAAKDDDGNIIDEVTIIKEISSYATLSIPDGGEMWEQNSTHTVTWEDNLDEKVKIDLYKGGALNLTITDSTESDGSYDWDIPVDQTVGDDYLIKVTSVDDSTITDESNAVFSIIPGTAISLATENSPFSINLKYYNSKISFNIPNLGGNNYPNVSLKIYDTKGKQIQTLVDGTLRTGRHSVNFDEKRLPAGLYICRLETEGFSKTTNIIIRK